MHTVAVSLLEAHGQQLCQYCAHIRGFAIYAQGVAYGTTCGGCDAPYNTLREVANTFTGRKVVVGGRMEREGIEKKGV